MGYLVTYDNGERRLVLGDRQQSLIDHNLASGHAEGVDALVLDEIKLPLVVRHFGCQSVLLQIANHGIGDVLPHTLHHGGVGGIGGGLCRLHILLILLVAETQHLLVADEDVLLASGDGDCGRCATACQDCHEGGHKKDSYFLHFLMLLLNILVAK